MPSSERLVIVAPSSDHQACADIRQPASTGRSEAVLKAIWRQTALEGLPSLRDDTATGVDDLSRSRQTVRARCRQR